MAAAVLVIATVPPAHAEAIDEYANGGRVTGTFSAYHNDVNWNMTIEDRRADGDCVYIEVNPDIPNHTDPEFHSSHACGVGDTARFTGSKHYVNLNGVRVKICRTTAGADPCDQVDYNHNQPE